MDRLRHQEGVIELLEGPNITDGNLWFAMRYYPERDLNTWLGRAGQLSVRARINLVNDLIKATSIAHSRDIVHRDIRPGNILVHVDASEARAILSDFDIAYFEDELRRRDTTVAVLGQRRYLPPDVFSAAAAKLAEVLRRKSNDLYALNVVALDLFTREELSLSGITRKQIAGALDLVPGTSKSGLGRSQANRLSAFFVRGLSSEPFSSALEFQRAWTAAVSPPPFLKPMTLAILVIIVLASAVLLDFLWFTQGDNFWIRALGTAFFVASSGSLFAVWLTFARSALPKWFISWSALVSQGGWRGPTLASFACAMVVGLAWMTDPQVGSVD